MPDALTSSSMNRQSRFSYRCNQCGRCCRNQSITLSPVDVIAIARATGLTTSEAVVRYTMRRGSLLRFGANGACVALDWVRCTIHRGRPLACRLYPLGLERDGTNERFVRLEPAADSAGVYGDDGIVGEFLRAQDIDGRLKLNELYRPLISTLGDRAASVTDFETIEPREFWRRAVAEALRETNYDSNLLIDAIFDADRAGCYREAVAATVEVHMAALINIVRHESDGAVLAAAAVLLAVSLGYPPSEAISGVTA
jgi:Fe-S-cluster containining protein